MNRAYRRYARMTGREEPSRRELQERLERRVLEIEGPEGLEKRFNRIGVPRYLEGESRLEKRYNRMGVPARHKASASKGASLLEAKKKGGKGGKGAQGAQGAQGGPLDDTNTADITFANAPSADDSLGLDIE